MPFLDVSEILFDPEIADEFNVLRQQEGVNGFGEVTPNVSSFNGIVGVVTMASPSDLDRLDDNQRMGRNISIVTQFRIRGPSPGYQPDKIFWQDDTYIVKLAEPYARYGAGFVQAIAGSIDSIEQPPPEGN